MNAQYDVAIVGSGIIGLAHAWHLAKRGLSVVVFERHPHPQGASVRNFGMIWPIGQPLGRMYDLARRSRELWREVLRGSGLWHSECGSLHVARAEDEAQVMREFCGLADPAERPVEMLTPAQIASRFPCVRQDGLHAGLWSPLEMTVDPRQVIRELPLWLAKEYEVVFLPDTTVLRWESPRVITTQGEWIARCLVICTGADFREILPDTFARSGLYHCKLQMLRSQAFGDRFRIGTMLAAGLTLRHYRGFAACPTLPELARRLDEQYPDYGRYGIHVLAAQNESGEISIGDSHEYGEEITPFDKSRIDELILDYFNGFVEVPELRITERWNGIYVRHPSEPFIVARPAPDTIAVTGVGGAGMTLSLGLAEEVVNELLGEETN
jgi:D-hydroxyproline dehydrogenase subunit beta